jgi:hypothetical protein
MNRDEIDTAWAVLYTQLRSRITELEESEITVGSLSKALAATGSKLALWKEGQNWFLKMELPGQKPRIWLATTIHQAVSLAVSNSPECRTSAWHEAVKPPAQAKPEHPAVMQRLVDLEERLVTLEEVTQTHIDHVREKLERRLEHPAVLGVLERVMDLEEVTTTLSDCLDHLQERLERRLDRLEQATEASK